MKRPYICTGCGTRQEFECSENVIEPHIMDFCPVCGEIEEFVMASKVVKWLS